MQDMQYKQKKDIYSLQNKDTTKVFLFGRRPLIAFLAFLSAFTPISTDLYLPSLPSMVDVFHSSTEIVGLTISLFMLFFAISMPVWGPLSDRYGRRPILFAGAIVYTISSLACMMATDIHFFIVCRCFQAIGGGALGTVSMAVVKDVFHGREMENILTLLQVILPVAPVVAPILGAFLLKIATWRTLFAILTLCGIIGGLGTLALHETHKPDSTGEGSLKSLLRLVSALKIRKFRIMLIIFSLPTTCFMSYLASSSYVYINEFGLTPQMYSFYFAINAGASILGPILYIRLWRDIPKNTLFTRTFVFLALICLVMLIFGGHSAEIFMLLIVLMGIVSHAIRPPATMLMMNIMDKDNGTAASLIGCVGLLFGSLGMLLCSLPWPSAVMAVSGISIAAATIDLLLWLFVGKKLNSTK